MRHDRIPSRVSSENGPETGGGASRRQFLSSVGLGGLAVLGAVGLGQLGSAPPAAADPPVPTGADPIWLGDRINALVVQEHGAGWNWSQWCEKAQWYAYWAVTNSEANIASYGSAQIAYNNSQIASTDPAAAPPGSFSFWTYNDLGHVATNIGNGYCINTSTQIPPSGYAHNFDHGLYISAIAAEPLPYLGWSYGHGANAQLFVAPYTGG